MYMYIHSLGNGIYLKTYIIIVVGVIHACMRSATIMYMLYVHVHARVHVYGHPSVADEAWCLAEMHPVY